MSIQRINFQYQLAQVGVRGNTPARLQISSPRDNISIQNGSAELQIDTQIPRFRGNRKQVNNESGLMDPLTFAKQFRDKGNRGAMQATANYARDGDFIANPKIPGDKSIPMMAGNKMKRVIGPKDKNIGLMPSSIPSLDWDKGYIRVNATRQNVSVDWRGRNTAQVSADTTYPVDVQLIRQPSFNVTGTVQNVTKSTYASFTNRAVTKATYGTYIDRMI